MSRAVMALLAALVMQPSGSPDQERLLRHRNLGKAFYENPTTQAQAVEEFRQALELAPKSAQDRLNYGLALLNANRRAEGLAELEAVQRQDPSIPHTWFNLGVAYKQKGEYGRAIEQFREMLKLAPDEPVSHYNLGFLYELQGDLDGALREFQTAARLDPAFVAPLYRMFTTYRKQGREAEAARALERFQQAKRKREQQEGTDAAPEDVNWSRYAEIPETLEARPAAGLPPAQVKFEIRKLTGRADPRTAGVLTLDAFGDGRASLLVWSGAGMLLYRNGSEPVDAGLASVHDVVSAAAGDFNNDGLPDLCVLTRAGAALYRNRGGRFEPEAVKLPAGPFAKALWLDYDHDYDVDLLLLGPRPALVRNHGSGKFDDRTAEFPFVTGGALDAVALRVVPESKANDVLVSYGDRAGVWYRDRLAGVYEAVTVDALPAGATALAAFDSDNDGWVDAGFRSAAGVTLLLNRRGRFEPTRAAADGPFIFADLDNRGAGALVTGRTLPVEGVAWAQADFDGDGRTDLAGVAADGSVRLLANRTVTRNGWVEVRLTGVRNMKLAPGTEVEVKAGALYQKKVYQGVPLWFGTGPYKQLDTVRVTWPNGMIQNEVRQAAGRTIEVREAPRLSGSCPMIFTWNGREFEFITDVLGVAPLGASSGDGQFFPVDHDEYITISGDSLKPVDGRYEIRITEELSEVTYLDQVRLMALDHPAEMDVFTNDKWKSPPFPEFRLFGVTRRVYPDVAALRHRDRVYADGFRRDFAGVAEMHALELDFGTAAPDNRAVLILNGWVDWADGSTFRASSQDSAAALVPPYLQVKDAAGRWKTVIEDLGMPSGKTKTMAVDLTGKFEGASRQVRIATNLCVYWDEVFLGESSAPPPARLTAADAALANLRFRGFSRVTIHPERKQPEYFEYASVAPVSMWNPTPGFYTRYGDVGELLTTADDRMVIMGSGDELGLSFDAAAFPALPAGWKRDFLLLVDGWAKDRDANTAFSQSVEPLPFHGMSQYPYSPEERFPDDAAHRAYRSTYNTRPALRLVRPITPFDRPGTSR
ncbi:MAG TPA: tetratricopeptide repeat protein [Bryobacteraceae bacterium]|nr:tetratricopeptide repeat protein [Bryobacteraceae bacterium]